MSGLLTPSVWPGPPRELNDAMTSPFCAALTPAVMVAISPVWLPRNANSACALRELDVAAGRKWLSVSWSVWPALPLYRIMPTAPPWRTLKPFGDPADRIAALADDDLTGELPGIGFLVAQLVRGSTTMGSGPTPFVSEMPGMFSVRRRGRSRARWLTKARAVVLARDGGHPRAAMVGGVGAGSGIAGRSGDEDARVVGVEECELDRVGDTGSRRR